MAVVIRVHFDGKTLVPDEPVDLPVNEPMEAELRSLNAEAERRGRAQEAWERLKARKVRGSSIPLEALRRENLYEDRL